MLQTESQVASGCLQPLDSHLSLVSVPDLTALCLLGQTFRTERTGEFNTPLASSESQAKAVLGHHLKTLWESPCSAASNPYHVPANLSGTRMDF